MRSGPERYAVELAWTAPLFDGGEFIAGRSSSRIRGCCTVRRLQTKLRTQATVCSCATFRRQVRRHLSMSLDRWGCSFVCEYSVHPSIHPSIHPGHANAPLPHPHPHPQPHPHPHLGEPRNRGPEPQTSDTCPVQASKCAILRCPRANEVKDSDV